MRNQGPGTGTIKRNLGSDQSAGHCGIHIANNNHNVGPLGHHNFFIFLHDLSSLGGVCAGTDTQVDIRLGKTKVAEEGPGHDLIVVLSCVDEHMSKLHCVPMSSHSSVFGDFPIMRIDRGDDRSSLHEIWSCANDSHDFHGSVQNNLLS